MIKQPIKSLTNFKIKRQPSNKKKAQSLISTTNLIKNNNNNNHNNCNQNSNQDIILNVATAFGLEASKGKLIDFKIFIKCTNETFNVLKFPISMKIKELKACLEFICGIPYNLQRLSYLDDGELIDTKELQYYDVIDGAMIIMDVWTIYVGLVKAAVFGNLEDLLKQGVSPFVEWTSPTHDYMFARDRIKYIKERNGIALFIAAHRGNLNLVKDLMSHSAHLNYKSSYGRTPLMVSVVANKTNIIDFLLENNADIEILDINSDSALTIAKKFNNKLGQHRLTQFKWKKRTEAELKAKQNLKKNDDEIFPEKRLPHQIFDSSKKTWFKGDFMQVYMMQLVPQSEFSGGSISAPKSIGKQVLKTHKQGRSISELKLSKPIDELDESENGRNSPIQSGLTFDKWLAQKLRAKRIEKQKLKKAEAEKENENKDDVNKDSTFSQPSIEPDNTIWMKDYSKPTMISSKFDLFDNIKKGNNFNNTNSNNLTANSTLNISSNSNNFTSNSVGSLSANRSNKNLEFLNIYKGMNYDEWIKIRDSFLKSHNMI